MESNVAQLPLSHKAIAWFEKNRNQALTGAAVAIVAGCVVAFFVWHAGEKQLRASNALSDVAASQTGASEAAQSAIPQAYLKVASEYPGSKAGARALLLAAGGLFTEGKYNEAQAQFERFTREYRSSELLGEALLGIASCVEAQGKADQAIAAYRDLITRHPTESVVIQAKFSLARLYEGQKKLDQARDMYKDVSRDSPYSILGSEAEMKLRDMAEKNPELAVPAAVPTPLPTVAVPAPTGTAPPGTNSPAQPNK